MEPSIAVGDALVPATDASVRTAARDASGRAAPASAPLRNPSTERVLTADMRASVGGTIRDIREHRDLLLQLAGRDVRIRYKQATMGFAWAVLTPLLVIGAGTVMRVAVASLAGIALDRSEIGALALKAFPWAFFAGAVGFAVQSITGNITLVTKVYFPRAILPLASVTAQLFDLAIGAAVLLLLLPFLGATLSLQLLWVPPLVLLLVLLTAGVGVFLGCANLFFRDVKYITQVMLTFGVFFTPVLFDAAAFGRRGVGLLMLNPLSPIFEGLRLAVMQGHNLLEPLTQVLRSGPVVVWEPWYLLYAAVWSVGGLAGALVLFQRTQFLFAEYV